MKSNEGLNLTMGGGILAKTMRMSWFIKCHIQSDEAEALFSGNYVPKMKFPAANRNVVPAQCVDSCIDSCVREVVVLQVLPLPNDMLLCEIIWKEDFDAMFDDEVKLKW
jgi:hypothetical protein